MNFFCLQSDHLLFFSMHYGWLRLAAVYSLFISLTVHPIPSHLNFRHSFIPRIRVHFIPFLSLESLTLKRYVGSLRFLCLLKVAVSLELGWTMKRRARDRFSCWVLVWLNTWGKKKQVNIRRLTFRNCAFKCFLLKLTVINATCDSGRGFQHSCILKALNFFVKRSPEKIPYLIYF